MTKLKAHKRSFTYSRRGIILRILMTLFSITFVTLAVSFYAKAKQDEAVEPPPLDPAYYAEHPMVLVNKASTIFAYYLSGYEIPHNVQLVYKLSVKDLSLIQLVRDSQLVTIKPTPFNLQRLMRGEKVQLTADVYIGDYRKEGMKVYESRQLNFETLLYVRDLNEIKDSSNKHQYEVVKYNNETDRLFVHHLQKKPSFAQLLHIDMVASCRNSFFTSSAVPKESELLYKFINCGTITPLYFDNKSYQ